MYLGIEIGGTKLQLGIGNGADVRLVELQRCDVNRDRGAAEILDNIARLAPPMIAAHQVTRIGIGFGGPVNKDMVTKSHQVNGWDQFPLVAWCHEQLGLEAVLGNDCDVAALAEALIGAGGGAESVFYVTVGTGVGGGLAIHGRNLGENRPAIAEIGHLRPGLDATSPNSTVESLASGLGIVRTAWRLSEVLGQTELSRLEARIGLRASWTAKSLAIAAAAGEPLAASAIEGAIRALGWAIAQVITIIAPQVIVVGGGVSLMGDEHFFEPLRQHVSTYVFPPLRNSYRILPAELGEEAVVHGAIALAANRH